MRISDQEYNRLNVLKLLRRGGRVSRTELARRSGLTGGSITEITGTLLARGLLIEEKVPSAGRGRPRINLTLNPAGACALAAFIGIDGNLVAEIVDLRGDVVHRSSVPMPRVRDMGHLAQAIAQSLFQVLNEAAIDRPAVRCAGIALPAVVDTIGGVVHWMQTITGTPFPLAEHVRSVIGIPVTIDNNINVLARAEHWFGASNADAFTLINLGFGISAAHYRGGQLASGVHGLNSEMGHAKIVVEDGLECSCGAHGCLDAYCSITGLVRQIVAARGDSLPPLQELAGWLDRRIAEAEAGDAAVRRILERAGSYFGVALANHVNGFDPGRIIVLSDQWTMPGSFRDSVHAALAANVLPPLRTLTAIEFRQYGPDLFRQGAAALVLEQLYRLF